MRRDRGEAGQTVIEFALICLVMLILTVGVVDVGRAFYEYNALANAARIGARWGSVVGGECGPATTYGKSTNDWCDQLGTNSTSFWRQPGNWPAQALNAQCPSTYSSSFSGYYRAADYYSGTATTVVGAVAQKFDSSSTSRSFITGPVTPAFDLTKLYVCIQLPYSTNQGTWSHAPGDTVTVYTYYPFHPAAPLLGGQTINLVASSEYLIE